MVNLKIFSNHLLLHSLVLLFGAGAWIATNGIWVELPLIVNSAPELWMLPSYLTIILQIGNIGPIFVTIMQILCPTKFNQNAMIYIIVGIGTLACFLLSFFWNSTINIAGQPHSVALFILWFAVSFVDCTSSVTFLPFMKTFQTAFLTTYFIGEGLAGFLPSVFAMIQGIQNVVCVNESLVNSTTNITSYHFVTHYTHARYSVDLFFGLLSIIMLACTISFILLNHLDVARRFYTPDLHGYCHSTECIIGNENDESNKLNQNFDNTASSKHNHDNDNFELSENDEFETEETMLLNPLNLNTSQLNKRDYVYLLWIIFYINFISNGVLPALSSYSSLPYGSLTYHLAACLGNMANPIGCCIAIFVTMHSFAKIGAATLVSSGLAAYLMFLAKESPCPILVNETAGALLTILANILFIGTASYIKTLVAQIFRIRGHEKALLWYGAVVQVGSMTGAWTMFPLVGVYGLFRSGDPCTTVCL